MNNRLSGQGLFISAIDWFGFFGAVIFQFSGPANSASVGPAIIETVSPGLDFPTTACWLRDIGRIAGNSVSRSAYLHPLAALGPLFALPFGTATLNVSFSVAFSSSPYFVSR